MIAITIIVMTASSLVVYLWSVKTLRRKKSGFLALKR